MTFWSTVMEDAPQFGQSTTVKRSKYGAPGLGKTHGQWMDTLKRTTALKSTNFVATIGIQVVRTAEKDRPKKRGSTKSLTSDSKASR